MKLNKPVISDEMISKIIKSMLESGRKYSQAKKSPCPLMYSYYDTEYLGAGHGMVGILLGLLR